MKHKIEDIVLITLFAVMAKCDEWIEIENEINNVFKLLDVDTIKDLYAKNT